MATANKMKLLASSVTSMDPKKRKGGKINQYKERFRNFASITTSNNQFYMTPKDFIDSLTGSDANKKKLDIVKYEEQYFKRYLFDQNLSQFKNEYVKTGSFSEVFERIDDQGLLAYCDYLLLLTILSKSERQFSLAFRLLDENNDETIELSEYATLESFFVSEKRNKQMDENVKNKQLLKKIFFGKDYKETINFHQFHAFAVSLHKEVLKKEFQMLQIGENTPISSSEISAKSFSIAVLRNTQLPPDEIEARIDKIANMYSNETVSFEEFLNFNKFLQGLDDFAIALRFMEKGKFKIGPKELAQAVKITIDVELPELITNIMYSIFDFNDDGSLSHKEVIGIMRSRLDRGLRNYLDQKNMNFPDCVKHTGYKQRILQSAE